MQDKGVMKKCDVCGKKQFISNQTFNDINCTDDWAHLEFISTAGIGYEYDLCYECGNNFDAIHRLFMSGDIRYHMGQISTEVTENRD